MAPTIKPLETTVSNNIDRLNKEAQKFARTMNDPNWIGNCSVIKHQGERDMPQKRVANLPSYLQHIANA